MTPKDIVIFYRGEYKNDPQARMFYMVDFHHRSTQVFPAGRNDDEDPTTGENMNDEVADNMEQDSIVDNMEEDAMENAVKLFGVQIGKRRPDHHPFFEVL